MMGNHLLFEERQLQLENGRTFVRAELHHHLMHNIWNLLSPIKSIQLGAASKKDCKIPFSKAFMSFSPPKGGFNTISFGKTPPPESCRVKSWLLLIHCGKSVTLIHGGFRIMHMPFSAQNNCVSTRKKLKTAAISQVLV